MNKNEKYKYARAFIVLMAALVTLLLNLKYKRDLLVSLIILLIVIVVFIVISSIALFLIDKIANMTETVVIKDTSSEDEELEEENDSEEN